MDPEETQELIGHAAGVGGEPLDFFARTGLDAKSFMAVAMKLSEMVAETIGDAAPPAEIHRALFAAAFEAGWEAAEEAARRDA